MCHETFHICKYCKKPYKCKLQDTFCPTINEDVDRNLCNMCRVGLELKIDELDEEVTQLTIEEIMRNE